MTETRHLISAAAFEPAALEFLAEIFDEVWASASHGIGGNTEHIESARRHLAKIILALSKDRQLGPLQLCRTAGRLMKQTPRGEAISMTH